MRTRSTVLAAGALALSLLLAACGSASHTSDGTSGSTCVRRGPERLIAADIAFAQLMIPHHQQAIEMADLALERPTSPEVERPGAADQGGPGSRDRDDAGMARGLGRAAWRWTTATTQDTTWAG
jgi:hypothetical protein